MSTPHARYSVKNLLMALVAAAMALVLAACGGTESTGSDDATSGVKMSHKYGSTELPKNPKKVVTLGLNDQDAVLSLGIKPVGVVDWFGERPYGSWPWTKQKWGSTKPTIVGERDDFSIEKVAQLKPDLIIAQYSGMTKDQYEKLSKIAPTVGQPAKYPDYAAPWRVMTERIGRAVGKEAEAKQQIAEVDKKFQAIRKQHPEYAKQTVAVGDSFTPGEYALFAAHDPKVEFMTDLGFKPSDRITKVAGKNNAAEVSAERLDLLDDADQMVWLLSDTAAEKRIKADETYQRSSVARQGRDLFIQYENPPIGAAVSFNTVLSIPYAIDNMAPLVEKQAAKEPAK
ncbi:MAG: ABC transporter substrate-binding protein [Pseudonocardiaceae bacterium]|nr:ABC transporter substrate-binding protein [Pseudonocardiaceae bacterium]